jgi:formamidopyrimidine-DNA glycosylase
MPELPEVETIKRQLSTRIKNRTIEGVKVNLSKIIKYPIRGFKRTVINSRIEQVKRRAKLLIIKLSNNYNLLIHLKMTGQLIFNGQPNKYTHLIFYFKDKTWLSYNDLRQFGFVKLIKGKDLSAYLSKESYGPEPLSKEFTLEVFKSLLKKRKKLRIKPFLMNQQIIAGIGNLYADEILFYAGVRPARRAQSLKLEEIKKVFKQIKRVLKLGIKKKGSSAEDYLDADGREGNFVPLIQVYQRTGQPCKKCGAKIEKIKIGQRSAHFCPKCQI